MNSDVGEEGAPYHLLQKLKELQIVDKLYCFVTRLFFIRGFDADQCLGLWENLVFLLKKSSDHRPSTKIPCRGENSTRSQVRSSPL